MWLQANNGKLTRPMLVQFTSLCLLSAGICAPVAAQETIYRCGQEYTNTPKDVARCQPLAEQNIAVIPGLRPQVGNSLAAPAHGAGMNDGRTKTEPLRPLAALQTERDVQARAILAQELATVQKLHLDLTQEYKQSAFVSPQTDTQTQIKSKDRLSVLKASIARTERDIESLRRELARFASSVKGQTP